MNPPRCPPATEALEFLRALNLAVTHNPSATGPALHLPAVLEELVTRLRWRSFSIWDLDSKRSRLKCVQSWSGDDAQNAWPTGVVLDRGDGIPGRALDDGPVLGEEPYAGGQAALALAVELGRSPRAVLSFGLPLSPDEVPGELVEIVGETGGGAFAHLYLADRRRADPEPLTPREHEVLRWAAEGFGVADIAKLLEIGPSTVKTHLEHVYLKLGVSDRASAVAQGFRAGLLR